MNPHLVNIFTSGKTVLLNGLSNFSIAHEETKIQSLTF